MTAPWTGHTSAPNRSRSAEPATRTAIAVLLQRGRPHVVLDGEADGVLVERAGPSRTPGCESPVLCRRRQDAAAVAGPCGAATTGTGTA